MFAASDCASASSNQGGMSEMHSVDDESGTFPQGPISTNIVECGVSMVGINIMIWGSIPHAST